jgi:hypothetical protein
MKTYNTLITEISFNFLKPLKNLFNSIVERVRNAINSLSFGEKISVRINMNMLKEDTIDMKSRLGYYSEYVTGYELSKLIENAGGNLTTERSKPSVLKGQMLQKKKELNSANFTAKEKKSLPGEMIRMESAGAALANQIFNDAILKGNDYDALQFDIHLTGVEEKGLSKSDLILIIGMMNRREIVDRISASLKAYQSTSINLANKTFISLVKDLFYDQGDFDTKKTQVFINKFVEDYGSKKELNRIYELQGIIKTEMDKGKTKESARKVAKLTHGEVIELIVKIFNRYYKENKEEINVRVLRILGLEGDEDFYASIGKTKQKVISSRKSEKLRDMMDKLKGDFTLHLERNKQTNNAYISFKSPNGELILDGNITFTDTGGKNPLGKTNAFIKMAKFTKK